MCVRVAALPPGYAQAAPDCCAEVQGVHVPGLCVVWDVLGRAFTLPSDHGVQLGCVVWDVLGRASTLPSDHGVRVPELWVLLRSHLEAARPPYVMWCDVV